MDFLWWSDDFILSNSQAQPGFPFCNSSRRHENSSMGLVPFQAEIICDRSVFRLISLDHHSHKLANLHAVHDVTRQPITLSGLFVEFGLRIAKGLNFRDPVLQILLHNLAPFACSAGNVAHAGAAAVYV